MEYRADIADTIEGAENALYIAARSGYVDNVWALLEEYEREDVDINIKEADGWTALYNAAPCGCRELITMILEVKGIDLRKQTKSGETSLYRACRYGNVIAVSLLLAQAENFGYNFIDIANNDGWTPLHTACAQGENETVRVLLENAAEADRKDKIEQTPLHVTNGEDRGKTVAFLLLIPKGGTVIDVTDTDKHTALHVGAERDNSDTVKVLINGRA